jgi:aspartate-semialdehyde dehydrogenase
MKISKLEEIGSLAIVGATGMVGQEFLEILEERKIKVGELKVLASEDSAGEAIEVGDRTYRVEALGSDSFRGVEVAFFSVPTEVTRRYVPIALEAGALIIDDSSVYRMHPEVPLVIPEINGSTLRDFQGRLISQPNCSATPVAMCLRPLQEMFGVERVVVSTYQSVSGAGRKAYEELSGQTAALLNGATVDPEVFPHQIAFNCLPQIGSALENGATEEEEKIVNELRKLLGAPELKVAATAVRVPTFCSHGASVNVELKSDFGSVEQVRELLDNFPGLKVLDKPSAHIYPTNMECTGSDLTMVGRVRRDRSVPHGLAFWVMTDNLRKGAALNSLQILETVYHYRRMS